MGSTAVTLRTPYRALRPDLDGFLFSQAGDERRGIPLSMISVLTRLGLDPWEEAGRLSSLSKPEATEQLARLLRELPGRLHAPPYRRCGDPAPRQLKHPWHQRWSVPRLSAFDALCVAVGAAALFSVLMH